MRIPSRSVLLFLVTLAGSISVNIQPARAMLREGEVSPASAEVAKRYFAAIKTKDAATVVALLSPSAKREFYKRFILPLPFIQKSTQGTKTRMAVFGCEYLLSLTEPEIVLKALTAKLRDADLADVTYKTLGAVNDGQSDLVVCKATSGESSQTFLLEVRHDYEDSGIGVNNLIMGMAADLAEAL